MKTELERADRDLFNIKYRHLNGTELDNATQEIYDRIEAVKNNIPLSVMVTENKDFVKFPTASEISNASAEYANIERKLLTSAQMKAYENENIGLQKALTVTVRAYAVTITYSGGKSRDFTVIEKQIDGSIPSGLSLIEIIPKEIAKSASEVTIGFEDSILLDDPIIEVLEKNATSISYYVEKKIDLKAVEKTQTLLLSNDFFPKSQSKVIGFSIFSQGFDNVSKKILIEVGLIIVLGAIFLVYTLGSLELPFAGKSREKMLDRHIKRAILHLENNEYPKARKLYASLGEKYAALPKKAKARAFSSLSSLAVKMDYSYLLGLIDSALQNIEKKDCQSAKNDYAMISKVYNTLPKEEQAKVHERCTHIYRQLKG